MRPVFPRLLATGFALALALTTPAARAQDAAPVPAKVNKDGAEFGFEPRPSSVIVSARDYQPVPEDAAISVSARDDNDVNLKVREALIAALAARHRPLGAGLALRFSTSADAVFDGVAKTPIGQAYAVSNTESEIVAKLFSTSQDSVIGGPARNTGARVDQRWRIRATLDDAKTGVRLWEATVVATEASGDATRELIALLDPLLDAFGRTVTGAIPVPGSVGTGGVDPNYLPIPLARGAGSASAPSPIPGVGLSPVTH